MPLTKKSMIRGRAVYRWFSLSLPSLLFIIIKSKLHVEKWRAGWNAACVDTYVRAAADQQSSHRALHTPPLWTWHNIHLIKIKVTTICHHVKFIVQHYNDDWEKNMSGQVQKFCIVHNISHLFSFRQRPLYLHVQGKNQEQVNSK